MGQLGPGWNLLLLGVLGQDLHLVVVQTGEDRLAFEVFDRGHGHVSIVPTLPRTSPEHVSRHRATMPRVKPFSFIADAYVTSGRTSRSAPVAPRPSASPFALADHLVDMLAPIPYLATVAAATGKLRISAFVHNNDLRHPAILAKDLATLDVLDGRLDVALGAGWNRPEYDAIGLAFDPVGTRVARLTEAVRSSRAASARDRSRSMASTTTSPSTTATKPFSSRIRRSSSVAAGGGR